MFVLTFYNKRAGILLQRLLRKTNVPLDFKFGPHDDLHSNSNFEFEWAGIRTRIKILNSSGPKSPLEFKI